MLLHEKQLTQIDELISIPYLTLKIWNFCRPGFPSKSIKNMHFSRI